MVGEDHVNERFKIYPEHLRNGRVEDIEESFEADFIGVNDEDLQFKDTVTINGEAYLADENLILNLCVNATAVMPCVICNEPVEVPVDIDNLYYVESLAEIKNGYFSLQNMLREAVLVEAPKFAECRGGNCLAREVLEKFLKNAVSAAAPSEELEGDRYHPFADIDIEIKPKT